MTPCPTHATRTCPTPCAHLPPHAQEIYREAFNHAWQEYAGDPRGEEVPHRVAWAAVKRQYRKLGDTWVPIGD